MVYYRPTCEKCGEALIGDGYKTVMRCEFAEPEDYEFHEPDAAPVYCRFEETEDAASPLQPTESLDLPNP